MSILNEINAIIHSSCEITGSDKKKLEEVKESMEVNLSIEDENEQEYLLYNFEKIEGGKLYPFFMNIKRLKAIADYVLITQKKQTIYVLIFELKKTRQSHKRQLYATKALMEFIIKRFKHLELKTRINLDVQYRMIAVSKNVRKKTFPKVYDDQGYCSFSGKQLKLDIYLQ